MQYFKLEPGEQATVNINNNQGSQGINDRRSPGMAVKPHKCNACTFLEGESLTFIRLLHLDHDLKKVKHHCSRDTQRLMAEQGRSGQKLRPTVTAEGKIRESANQSKVQGIGMGSWGNPMFKPWPFAHSLLW